MKLIVCLDQEGVITENHESKPGCEYFNIFPQDVQLRPGVIAGFTLLKRLYADVHIVTNQAWIELASGGDAQLKDHLVQFDLAKRCRVIQLLGPYSEVIKGWWVSTEVGDDVRRSVKKAQSLYMINQIPESRLIWIGDTRSDALAGAIANDILKQNDIDNSYISVCISHNPEAEIKDLYQALLSVLLPKEDIDDPV